MGKDKGGDDQLDVMTHPVYYPVRLMVLIIGDEDGSFSSLPLISTLMHAHLKVARTKRTKLILCCSSSAATLFQNTDGKYSHHFNLFNILESKLQLVQYPGIKCTLSSITQCTSLLFTLGFASTMVPVCVPSLQVQAQFQLGSQSSHCMNTNVAL